MANFFDQVIAFFKKKQDSGKPQYIIGGPAIYPEPNLINYIKLGFSGNGSIYTIVSTAARKFGYLPRYAYKITEQKSLRSYRLLLKTNPVVNKKFLEIQKKAYDETIVEDDFDKLLKRPNPDQGQDTFYANAYIYYAICGEAFIWLNRGDIDGLEDAAIDEMPVLEMWVLPSQYVVMEPDPQDINGVLGYFIEAQGPRIPIRKNDMVHWKKPNPNFDLVTRKHLRGLSPLQPGNKIATQDDSATDAMVASQQNDGAKGVLYNKTLDNVDAGQKSQIESVVNRRINNRDLKSAVATLQGEWGYLDISQTSQEKQTLETQQGSFVRLCNLFGVPAELFITQNTYDNKDQARRDLITSLLLPDACSLRDEMNLKLLPAFYKDPLSRKQYTHDIDITDLPELQEDMSKKVTALASAWWFTPNERREQMNEEPDTDTNMDKIWIPNNLVAIEDAAMAGSFDSVTPNLNDNSGTNNSNRGKNVSGNNG